MHDSFVAVGFDTDVRHRARALRAAWEDARGGDRPRVREVIARSWARLDALGARADRLTPRAALDGGDLRAARADSPLTALLPLLRDALAPVAADDEHVLVVADAAGRVLWLDGHPAVRRQAERATFDEGMLWTEESAGTNAIGTAIAIDRAVQVFSAEHFLPAQHAFWCSAAPIHDPASNRLLGVVDLTGPARTAHPYSLALVRAAAALAETALATPPRPAAPPRRAWGGTDTTDVRESVPAGRSAGRGAGGRRAGVEVRLLGARPEVRRPGAPPQRLRPRHADVLAILALHPEGRSAEQLTLALYGDGGNRITTRAEVSRLRRALGPLVAAQPYRLVRGVEVDLVDVERLLAAGAVADALDRFTGPLLPASEAPRVVQAREELEWSIRRAAIGTGVDTVWRWLETEPGREDYDAMVAFVDMAPRREPRRALIEARLASLAQDWGLPQPRSAAGAPPVRVAG